VCQRIPEDTDPLCAKKHDQLFYQTLKKDKLKTTPEVENTDSKKRNPSINCWCLGDASYILVSSEQQQKVNMVAASMQMLCEVGGEGTGRQPSSHSGSFSSILVCFIL
jgi:hypothetical protein